MSIKNRYEGKFYLACRNCNPNGDPDMGNAPRMDAETGIGYVTDVSLSRKVKDYVQMGYAGVPGMEIYHQRDTHLGKAVAEVCESLGLDGSAKAGKTRSKAEIEKTRAKACERFYDVRTFGAVMSAGPNAGQVQGPVDFAFAFSKDPVQARDITITRCATSKLKDGDDSKSMGSADYAKLEAEAPVDKLRTMGTKQFIPFGLYEVRFFVSASLAAQTGFDEDDLGVLFKAVTQMFDQSHSSSKGEMAMVSPLVIFKHVGDPAVPPAERARQAILGRAPAHKLFNLVDCHKKPDVDVPRDYKDYVCTVDMDAVPEGVEIGFLEPYAKDISWGALPGGETWMTEV